MPLLASFSFSLRNLKSQFFMNLSFPPRPKLPYSRTGATSRAVVAYLDHIGPRLGRTLGISASGDGFVSPTPRPGPCSLRASHGRAVRRPVGAFGSGASVEHNSPSRGSKTALHLECSARLCPSIALCPSRCVHRAVSIALCPSRCVHSAVSIALCPSRCVHSAVSIAPIFGGRKLHAP